MVLLSLTSTSLLSIRPPHLASPSSDLRALNLKKNLNHVTIRKNLFFLFNSSSFQFENFQKPYILFLQRRKNRNVKCRAEFSQDAPFAMAIGACILNSLVFPISKVPNEDSESVIDSNDARFAVMGIISFIPYFNWLSWVFAWLDTSRQRYVVYSIVYLAPYLRTNLSLKPEESWLPIASIIFCIFHIQLEASILNGDLQGFQLFNEALKFVSPSTKKKDADFEGHQRIPMKGKKKERTELPSAQEQTRNQIQGWEVPERPLDQHLNEDEDAIERKEE